MTHASHRARAALLALFVASCVPPQPQYPSSQPSSSYDESYTEDGAEYATGGGGGRGRMWFCRAEATTVYGRGIDVQNEGPTRDAAALQALKDCGSMAGLSDVTSDGNEQHPVGARECEITRCWYAD